MGGSEIRTHGQQLKSFRRRHIGLELARWATGKKANRSPTKTKPYKTSHGRMIPLCIFNLPFIERVRWVSLCHIIRYLLQ